MNLLDFAAAGLISLLTGMGVGSGGLFVIYLTLIRHLPQHHYIDRVKKALH